MKMNRVLTGKVALVTGGSRGIGAASALALAAQGAHVAISYTANGDKAAGVVEALKAHGVKAIAVQAEQGDLAQATQLVAEVVAAFGQLDILVANAGAFEAGHSIDGDPAAFNRMRAVNVDGVIATIRAAGKVIRDNGRIIAMASAAVSRVGVPGLADYAASKAALVGYIKGVSRDLGPKGITVNALGIGPIETDMNPAVGDFADFLTSTTALGRYGHTEEVGAVVAFLASPSASYITGCLVPVDGGVTA
jgi:3-oxoacyl-[acyl-carrier protein] reductase